LNFIKKILIYNVNRLQALSLLGFTQMTPVQASTIPLFLNNKDVIVEVSIIDKNYLNVKFCKY